MRAGVRADRPFLSLSVRGALSLFFSLLLSSCRKNATDIRSTLR